MPHLTFHAFRKTLLYSRLCAAMAIATGPSVLFAADVLNCGDGGPGSGSLRDVVTSAASGDTIDLSQLPTKCGMADSVITLFNGEIVVPQENLKFQGPFAGSVTIEPVAGSSSRVLNHAGTGLLVINDLTLANGNLQAGMGHAYGGCIRSDGSLFLTRSTVKNCIATGSYGSGGGLYAAHGAVLLESRISGNKAIGSARGMAGGVLSIGGLSLLYSTVDSNEASHISGGAMSLGSGIGSYTALSYSTFEGNSAPRCGGASLYTIHGIEVSNSTISDNTGSISNGGLCAEGSTTITASTIAFNSSVGESGGLILWSGALTIETSIFAHNSSSSSTPDLYIDPLAPVYGADNLVMTSSGNIPPGVIKITSDPKLSPQLAFNGGRTRTHKLLPGSPALGAGNNPSGLWFDQRGQGYPRMSGSNAATDIGAVQFDSIFFDDFDR
jgi:hypothetical protein